MEFPNSNHLKSKNKLAQALRHRRHAVAKSKGVNGVWYAIAGIIVFVLVLQAGLLSSFGVQPLNAVKTSSTQTVILTSTGSPTVGSVCEGATGNSIQSKLVGNNGQSESSATVNIFQQQGGVNQKLIDSSGSVTAGTFSTAGNPYNPPYISVFNSTAAYPLTQVVTSLPMTSNDPLTGQVAFTALCLLPSGGTNNAYVTQQTGTVWNAPASGTTATTNVESVVNSQTSQTNSFPTAFPTTSQTESVYLQLFANNVVAMKPVSIPGSINTPITDYGGVNGVPVQSVVNKGQPTQYSPYGLSYYQGYLIAVFNQTQLSFTGPAGTVPLTVRGSTGVVAWLVPVSACGPTGTSGTSTTSPNTSCTVQFTVNENVSPTGHHIDMVLIWADNAQAGFIMQNFAAPAVTSFPAAGNAAGIPSGFSGIVPPTTSNAPHQSIEQSSKVIATW